MERLTSDDLHSSSAEKTVISSGYYSYTRPSQNGYTSVAIVPPSTALLDETSDAESERVGVFDYVLSSSQHTNNRSLCSAVATEDDPGGSRQKWAQDLNSLGNGGTCCDSGTELTMFHCAGSNSDACSRVMNDGTCGIGSVDIKADADNCSDLEEIVVHSEPQSQRASYERFNPDFPYSRVCASSSSSAHEPATVFLTSVNKSSSHRSSYAIDTSDERDVIERRSHHYTTLRKSAYLFQILRSLFLYFKEILSLVTSFALLFY